ncbi:hypothetical protein NNRS527_03168 (plasmid) [Nitrosospira sp. NRS527]|nr:hypothetical protein NNRS527_03168 [Nitrosospira sp. NRS527]
MRRGFSPALPNTFSHMRKHATGAAWSELTRPLIFSVLLIIDRFAGSGGLLVFLVTSH